METAEIEQGLSPETHPELSPPNYQCLYCDAKFPSPRSLGAHLGKKHIDRKSKAEGGLPATESIDYKITDEPLTPIERLMYLRNLQGYTKSKERLAKHKAKGTAPRPYKKRGTAISAKANKLAAKQFMAAITAGEGAFDLRMDFLPEIDVVVPIVLGTPRFVQVIAKGK